MPDGRMLSKSTAWSEQLNSVSVLADLLFHRMVPHIDREGRMIAFAKGVKGRFCQLREELTVEVIEACLQELHAKKLIVRYEAEGSTYAWFPGFLRHNTGARLNREAPSRIPPPPPEALEEFRRTSVVHPDHIRTESGPTPGRVSSVAPKRSEVKRSEVTTTPPPAPPAGARAREEPEPEPNGRPPTQQLEPADLEIARLWEDAHDSDVIAEALGEIPVGNRSGWRYRIRSWQQGGDLPANPKITAGDIPAGIAEYTARVPAENRDWAPKHVLTFIAAVARRRTEDAPARASPGKARDRPAKPPPKSSLPPFQPAKP